MLHDTRTPPGNMGSEPSNNIGSCMVIKSSLAVIAVCSGEHPHAPFQTMMAHEGAALERAGLAGSEE